MDKEPKVCDGCWEYLHDCKCPKPPTDAERQKAVKDAQSILKDEANELACMTHGKEWEALSHRAKVAIQNEIQRIRKIADLLGSK